MYINRYMDKEDVTHTHTHTHSLIKKNEILPFAGIQIDLEGIMLNEISQIQKGKYCMISLIYNLKIQENNEYIKKEADSQRTNQWLSVGWGSKRYTLLEGVKTGYKDILYNTGNIDNILLQL